MEDNEIDLYFDSEINRTNIERVFKELIGYKFPDITDIVVTILDGSIKVSYVGDKESATPIDEYIKSLSIIDDAPLSKLANILF